MPRRTSIRSVPPGVAVASAVSMLAQPSVQQSSRQPFFPSRRESTTPNSTPGSAAAYSATNPAPVHVPTSASGACTTCST